MTRYARAANPDVLTWARERAGVTVQQAASKIKKPPELVEDWEAGKQHPTFYQLEKLAEKVYRLPVAVFFFPEPPAGQLEEVEFRSLPDTETEALAPDTRFALREASAMQDSLRELKGGETPSDRRVLLDLSTMSGRGPSILAAKVREYVGITVAEQASWKSAEGAFKNWREAVEAAGVFVFKRSFKQPGLSAFCLLDDTFPLIYINNSTSWTRQSFSLFHELAHILYATNGLTLDDDSYIRDLIGDAKRIEVACNRLASEFLVPEREFNRAVSGFSGSEDDVGRIAKEFHVSREVVMRRLLDKGLVSRSDYERMAQKWAGQYRRLTKRGSGGSYYATKASYLGDRYLGLAFGAYHEGRTSLPELATHLQMKPKNVHRFEEYLVERA